MNYGKAIKKYRVDRRLTQQQLADKVGVSQVAIGYYEAGTREPDITTVKNIANILDVPLPLFVMEAVEMSDIKHKLRPAYKELHPHILSLINELNK